MSKNLEEWEAQQESNETLKRVVVACFDTRYDKPEWMTGSAAELLIGKLREKGITRLFPLLLKRQVPLTPA